MVTEKRGKSLFFIQK